MTRAYLLLTALPPTKGHRALIEWTAQLADYVNVIVCTQPDEPFTFERNVAVSEICRQVQGVSLARSVQLHLIHRALPQEPEDAPGFWDMWAEFLHMFGFAPGDIVVASESYGKTLAEHVEGVYMPFDIERNLNPQKATQVRNDPLGNFDWIDQTFQSNLIKHVTIFGAESTGKTTLSKALAKTLNGHWLYEYARPYLENTSPVVTQSAMHNIWQGQKATQEYGYSLQDKPFVFQDTDLFSTAGYWDFSEWSQLDIFGSPDELFDDALELRSDLYIVTPSNIPFEADQLRYGGDHREISDEVWIDYLKMFDLPYHVLSSSTVSDRVNEAAEVCVSLFGGTANQLSSYKRRGKEYQ